MYALFCFWRALELSAGVREKLAENFISSSSALVNCLCLSYWAYMFIYWRSAAINGCDSDWTHAIWARNCGTGAKWPESVVNLECGLWYFNEK